MAGGESDPSSLAANTCTALHVAIRSGPSYDIIGLLVDAGSAIDDRVFHHVITAKQALVGADSIATKIKLLSLFIDTYKLDVNGATSESVAPFF